MAPLMMFDHLKAKIRKADQDGLRSLTKKWLKLYFFDQSKSYVTFLANQTGENI